MGAGRASGARARIDRERETMQLLSPSEAAGRVTAALKGAAEATGAGFDYLVRTATRESSLNPTAKASTSSARGLFQFIDSTWLQVLKEEGPKLGLGEAAADVTKSASGRYTVADPQRRAELLALRDDPRASALLAGAFTRRNALAFQAAHGRAASEGELYAAHFLGAQGAIELTTLATNQPTASAAEAFPAQAAANRSIFYDKGRPRTAREVYDRLTATPGAAPTTAVASAAPVTTPKSAVMTVSLQSTVVDDAPAPYNGGREDDGRAFHSLFKTGRRSPVAAYVQQAWSGVGAAGLAADPPATAQRARAASAALSYANAGEGFAATPKAAAAVAAVDAAGQSSAGKKRAAKAKATPLPTPAPIAQAAQEKPAERKTGLLSFLGITLQAPTASRYSGPRGRP
ncbi:MAG: hypothetical protein DI565_05945 [Ancylobacter novellus]|uniref:Transglycosylase SLT domain-containing protein n=1 Tax=Ancylobacter novellus TaxID=921 RepID=A0A2W5KJ35_ANCNO|nr:MAG: hypothetical protein DI565_05945 [Ancylobacter novellus]